MRFPRRAAAWLGCLVVLAPAGRAHALKIERLARFSPASGTASYQEVASGSAVVRFKTGVSSSTYASLLEPSGFKILVNFERFNWSVVGLPSGLSVASGLQALRSMPQVEWAEPNGVYRAAKIPNDPFVGRQYALAQVQAFGAWEYETGFSSRTTIAFIDTGIDGHNSELKVKLSSTTSRAFTPESLPVSSYDDPPTPACNHATHAAGAAAASSDNSAGIAGISWGANLISLKVFSDSDCDINCCSAAHDCNRYTNTCGTTQSAIAAAINDIIPFQDSAGLGKIVVNISLGQPGGCPNGLQTAVTAAVSKGLLLFAAAGNDGLGVIDSPANCAGVHAVGATDSLARLASFSNTGTEMLADGITAPGVDVYTTDLADGYVYASGTSFSSPMAAGLAALLWSAKPGKGAADIWGYMKDSADDLGTPGPDWDFGWGRINALKAMRLAVTGSSQFAGTSKAVAYPNPFRPKTQRLATFSIPDRLLGSGVEVKVYTAEGELVKKLDSAAWDGRNEAGAAVASGVYIFRIKTDKDSAVGKLALIR